MVSPSTKRESSRSGSTHGRRTDIHDLAQYHTLSGERLTAAVRNTFQARQTQFAPDPVVFREAYRTDPALTDGGGPLTYALLGRLMRPRLLPRSWTRSSVYCLRYMRPVFEARPSPGHGPRSWGRGYHDQGSLNCRLRVGAYRRLCSGSCPGVSASAGTQRVTGMSYPSKCLSRRGPTTDHESPP
jgi:hypothetical protein